MGIHPYEEQTLAEGTKSSAGVSILRIIIGVLELWVAAIVLILGAAFVLGFFGANPNAAFAQWIYNRSNDLMTPFNGLFEPITLTGDTLIQTSLLFAILVYVVVGAVLAAIARRV